MNSPTGFVSENGGPFTGLKLRALEQMRGSTATGYDPYYDYQYRYVRPSPGRYNWQWFWDSCFHSVVNASLDPNLAKDELRSLITAQETDGMIGHMTYWGSLGSCFAAMYFQAKAFRWRRRHTALIQPPIIAQSVEEVWKSTNDKEFLKEILPYVRLYYDWLAASRDPKNLGLIAIISPFESGLDNSPMFDEVLGLRNPGRSSLVLSNQRLVLHNLLMGCNYNLPRIFNLDRFVVYDTFVNATFADGLRSLARLHRATGNSDLATSADTSADRVEAAINTHCWDSNLDIFTSLYGRDLRPLKTKTFSAIYPSILGVTPRDRRARVVERYLTNKKEFWTDFPIPTVACSEPSFDPSGEEAIWRGPFSMGTNWLMTRGLKQNGYIAEANLIVERSIEAAECNGFREFYNPNNGLGLRGTNFGWGTLAAVMHKT